MSLTTIKLRGHLGKRFGREFIADLDVPSPKESIEYLKQMLPGFTAYMLEHSEPGYRVVIGKAKEGIALEQLQEPTGMQSISIIPVVAGAKSDWVQVIAGAALIAVGVYFNQQWITSMGIAMVTGGVAKLLIGAPTPPQPGSDSQSNPSYLFNGPVNTTQQGLPVPVGYGVLRAGGHRISGGIVPECYASTPDSNPFGKIDATWTLIPAIGSGPRAWYRGDGETSPWQWVVEAMP